MRGLGRMLVLMLLSAGTAAQARDSGTEAVVNQAAAAFQLGRDLFNAKQYPAAVDAFERSYALSPRPQLLYNIGLAALNAGQPQKALRALQSYAVTLKSSSQRTAVERLIDELRESLKGQPPERAEAIATPAAPVEAETPVTPVETATPAAPAEPASPVAPSPSAAAWPQSSMAPVAPSPLALEVRSAPPRRPLVRRGWFWGAVAGGAVIVGGAIALGVVFGGSRASYPHADGSAPLH